MNSRRPSILVVGLSAVLLLGFAGVTGTRPAGAPGSVRVIPGGVPLYRHLDVTGDGTGSSDAANDYSTTPGVFKITPASDETFVISRLLVWVQDTGAFGGGDYGHGITITNGISVTLSDGSTTIDLTDGEPITSNSEWARIAYDLTLSEFSANANYLAARWTFARAGQALRLDGYESEELRIELSDDFSGLDAHSFMVQGWIVP